MKQRTNMNRRFTAEEIRRRLLELGAKEDEVPSIVESVTGIVEARIASAMVECLSLEERNHYSRKTEDEAREMLGKDMVQFLLSNEEKLFEIEDQTWSEYFQAMK